MEDGHIEHGKYPECKECTLNKASVDLLALVVTEMGRERTKKILNVMYHENEPITLVRIKLKLESKFKVDCSVNDIGIRLDELEHIGVVTKISNGNACSKYGLTDFTNAILIKAKELDDEQE